MSSATEFSQLRLKFIDPIQHNYEAIRPIVLFDESVSERSQQTGLERRRIGEKAQRFVQQGMLGLVDQLTLPFFKEVLDIQNEYPRAGKFRVRGLLEKQYQEQGRDKALPSERTVSRAMALNRQYHGAPGSWQSARDEAKTDTIPKYLPYRPDYRHHIWFVDVRYLVKIDDRWVYSLCIIEGYSRTILAGMASEHQDLTSVLQILYAALSEYGSPELIVSDNAKVFYAHHYLAILAALEIDPKYIEKGRPWQNLIEAQLKVQLRLADFKFEQAQTVEEIQNLHAEFIDTFNTTRHYAHEERADGRYTPISVLS